MTQVFVEQPWIQRDPNTNGTYKNNPGRKGIQKKL